MPRLEIEWWPTDPRDDQRRIDLIIGLVHELFAGQEPAVSVDLSKEPGK